MDQRRLGFGITLVGVLGTALAAFANPLGIGNDEVFGWLQTTGVIVGAIVALLGLALASGRIGSRTSSAATTDSTQSTTVVTDSPTSDEPTP